MGNEISVRQKLAIQFLGEKTGKNMLLIIALVSRLCRLIEGKIFREEIHLEWFGCMVGPDQKAGLLLAG